MKFLFVMSLIMVMIFITIGVSDALPKPQGGFISGPLKQAEPVKFENPRLRELEELHERNLADSIREAFES
ncbi:hypothetical protein JYU34_004029 [Plutella xylostella]|uniref:Uncharacterized protein n=1 Tax=Plutella xylostella TaxID=51655 RepID=A0ABQ7QWZ2_PLUXY|nr:hypothetical protein JYU34_004029 [Plutella xylostella]